MTRREQEQFAEWLAWHRENTIKAMAESAFVLQLVPSATGTGSDVDPAFCLQLGASIMLDKPVLAVVMPGREIPDKLRAVADEVVECDPDTEEGRERLQEAIARFVP